MASALPGVACAANDDDRDRHRLVLIHDADHTADAHTPRPVQLRADRAAQHLGLEVADIERLPFDLSALEGEGAFINVDARNFGLLDRRLDWRALGVSLPRRGDLAFRPPRCGLVPDRYRLPLLRPAGRAHAALQKYSYHFRLVETIFETPSYRWVPWRAWPAFESDFNVAQGYLRAALGAYETDYAAVRETVLEAFRQLAADSARRLEATFQPVPADFEEAVVREVLAVLPTPELLYEKLTLRFRVGVMHLGSEMLAEQHRAAEERRKLEAVDSARRLSERQQAAQEQASRSSGRRPGLPSRSARARRCHPPIRPRSWPSLRRRWRVGRSRGRSWASASDRIQVQPRSVATPSWGGNATASSLNR